MKIVSLRSHLTFTSQLTLLSSLPLSPLPPCSKTPPQLQLPSSLFDLPLSALLSAPTSPTTPHLPSKTTSLTVNQASSVPSFVHSVIITETISSVVHSSSRSFVSPSPSTAPTTDKRPPRTLQTRPSLLSAACPRHGSPSRVRSQRRLSEELNWAR